MEVIYDADNPENRSDSLNWMFGKRHVVRCSDGTRKFVFKDPKDAFPILATARMNEGRVEAHGSSTGGVTGAIEGKSSSELDTLFLSLETSVQSYIAQLIGAYSIYANDPCAYADEYRRRVDTATSHLQRAQYARESIAGIVDLTREGKIPPEKATEYAREVMARYSPEYVSQETAAAIALTREEMSEWKKRTRS